MKKAGYCGAAVALFGLLFYARSGAASPDDGEVCSGLAQEIAKVSDRGDVPPGSILRVLAKDGGGLVHFDREEPLEGADAIRNVLRERFRLPAEDADKIDDNSGFERIALTIMESAQLAVVETEGGTLHCSDFQFFDVSGQRPVRAVGAPENSGVGYCWGSSVGDFATLGEIGGHPTFAVESFADGNETIKLFVRQGDGWAKSCHFAVSWKPDFAVKGANCQGAVCTALQQAAMDIVSQYDGVRDTASFWMKAPIQKTPDEHKERFASYLRDTLGQAPLGSWPTDPAPILARAQYRTVAFGDRMVTVVTAKASPRFARRDESREFAVMGDRASGSSWVVDMSGFFDGQAPEAQAVLTDMSTVPHGSSYPFTELSSDSVVAPIVVEGRTYLARIGHGWFAWRETDDYLVNVLEPDGSGAFRRSAGFLISKTRGREVSVRPLAWPNAPEAPPPSGGSGRRKHGNSQP